MFLAAPTLNMQRMKCRRARDLVGVKVSAPYDSWRSKKHKKNDNCGHRENECCVNSFVGWFVRSSMRSFDCLLRSCQEASERFMHYSSAQDQTVQGHRAFLGGDASQTSFTLPLLAWIPVAAAVLAWLWLRESKGQGGLLSDIRAHYPLRESLLGH